MGPLIATLILLAAAGLVGREIGRNWQRINAILAARIDSDHSEDGLAFLAVALFIVAILIVAMISGQAPQ